MAHEAQGQARAVHRNLETLEDVGQRADVILVGMGQDNRLRNLPLVHQVADVGDHQIDAQEFGAGEHDAAVHGDHGVAPLHREHVAAELSQASEGYDSQGIHLVS